MALPILHLSGTPYEQGAQHGRALRDQIAHNLRLYFERFERACGLPREEVLARAAYYLKAIYDQNRDYYAALRGIADVTRFNLHDLTALNVRYEILYHQLGANAMADGCTAFALAPEATADGHLLLGQNWDWIPGVQAALLHSTDADGFANLSFTEAGIVGGKIGLNAAGVGLAINGLMSTADDWARLRKPFHVRCYEVLRAPDFERAVAVITGEDRACSANFLIAQPPGHVADIEAAPGSVRVLGCERGCVVHANHFLDPARLAVAEPPTDWGPRSRRRHERMQALLGAPRPLALAGVQAALRDHADFPYSICRHESPHDPPEQQYRTIASLVLDLHARALYIADGPPCKQEYQRVELGAS